MLLSINPVNPNPLRVKKVVDVLKNDGIIIYPTDTVYGLGCSIFSKKAMKRLLTQYNEMDNEVRKLTGDVLGPLVLGASTTIGEYVIPSILGEYQAKFPDVSIRLHVANTEGVIHMVESNEIDIGIVEGPVNNKNLVSKVCWEDELVAVTPPQHPLAQSKTITPDKVLEYPFISREEGSGTREVIAEYFAANGLEFSNLNLTMEFGSPESIKSAVASGLGVSILSVATLDKELKLGMLEKTSFSPAATRPFSIVYQRQKFRLRAIEEFLAFTEAHCGIKKATA